MAYRVEISPSAGRQLRRLSSAVRNRIEPDVLSLQAIPRPVGVRKMVGTDRLYRIRVGDYRVVYEIDDDEQIVVILYVGRRTESTYRDF